MGQDQKITALLPDDALLGLEQTSFVDNNAIPASKSRYKRQAHSSVREVYLN